MTKTLFRALVINANAKENDYDYVVAEDWFDTTVEADYWIAWQSYLNALRYYDAATRFIYRKEEY